MQVVISHQAQKQFSKIPSTNQPRVKNSLELLAQTPLAGKPLKGQLEGYFSLRCWPYRIIYQIDTHKKLILVLTIVHRQGAYK